jgi:hypothetical protein
MSSQRLRYAHTNFASARQDAAFLAWGWPGWFWGIVCWLTFLHFSYPTAIALYRGEIGPMSPLEWGLTIVVYMIVFLFPGAGVLYASWVFFVFVRAAPHAITVNRWFGLHRVAYPPSDVTIWRFVNRRSLDVPDAKSASRLRIEFADGSWVRVSRYAWNFRRLEAWLRQYAPAAGRPVWRLPDDGPSSRSFVVRDVGGMLFGLMVWVICWTGTVCCVLMIGRLSRDTATHGHFMRYAKLTVMFFASLIFGPVFARFMLKDVRIDAAGIHVERWFGLTRRTYREGDVTWWRVSLDPNPPWWREARQSSLAFRLLDGATILVTGNAANFHRLHEFLSAHASARQQVRSTAKKALSA